MYNVNKGDALEAGMAGGKYLESIGKFDLRTLSQEEWLEFLQRTIGRYKAAEDDIPF